MRSSDWVLTNGNVLGDLFTRALEATLAPNE